MTTEDRDAAIKCSTGALTMIYYVIVGLAITEALQNTFVKDEAFLGVKAFCVPNLPKTLLLMALLPTICRFVHGASIHLGRTSNKRYKPLVDFVGFFLQAAMFYLMALSLDTQRLFLLFFGVLLVFDTVWLITILRMRYCECRHTEVQWLVSNIVIMPILYGIFRVGKCTTGMVGAWLVVVVAVLATIVDYIMNREFYFPSQDRPAP